jgi:hypothetical protein
MVGRWALLALGAACSGNAWIVPRMRSPVADLLADLTAALAAANVEWFLFGAQAAIAYGVARLTADVDVTIRVPEGLPNSVWVDTLRTYGFLPRFGDPF